MTSSYLVNILLFDKFPFSISNHSNHKQGTPTMHQMSGTYYCEHENYRYIIACIPHTLVCVDNGPMIEERCVNMNSSSQIFQCIHSLKAIINTLMGRNRIKNRLIKRFQSIYILLKT